MVKIYGVKWSDWRTEGLDTRVIVKKKHFFNLKNRDAFARLIRKKKTAECFTISIDDLPEHTIWEAARWSGYY